MSVSRTPMIQGTWHRAKRGKWCRGCSGDIPEGSYYLQVDRYLWLCPGCARKPGAGGPRAAGAS
jgi:hypothetical protein